MTYWRIGSIHAPFSFSPLSLYTWTHRFDDIFHQFRSLYCAENMETCFRELLADLRPNLKAIMEFKETFGAEDLPPNKITSAWYKAHALVHVEPVISSGSFVDVEKIKERILLFGKHPVLFLKRGMLFPDITKLRKKDRHFTQKIARSYFDEGKAGVFFSSHLDHKKCLALFEGRAELTPLDDPMMLSPDMKAFQKVCREFHLQIIP